MIKHTHDINVDNRRAGGRFIIAMREVQVAVQKWVRIIQQLSSGTKGIRRTKKFSFNSSVRISLHVLSGGAQPVKTPRCVVSATMKEYKSNYDMKGMHHELYSNGVLYVAIFFDKFDLGGVG